MVLFVKNELNRPLLMLCRWIDFDYSFALSNLKSCALVIRNFITILIIFKRSSSPFHPIPAAKFTYGNRHNKILCTIF